MQNANIIDHEAFFTAGLLSDIGRMVIAKEVPEAIHDIEVMMEMDGRDLVQAEQDKLGLTHLDVGEALMQKWKMPDLLTECVVNHHNINHSGPFAIDTAIVYLANQLCLHPRPEDEEELQTILFTVPNWEQAACPMDQVLVACELADEQWKEVMESLGMMDMEIRNEEYY